jgi:ubiquinol-cytochrome c reductase cytochrome b subunit
MGVILLMPLIALIKGGHYFNVMFMSFVAAAVVGLTVLSVVEDRHDLDHQAALAEAARDAERVIELAQLPDKIPVQGAGALLAADPFTQGPRLFAKHCASCHRFDGHDGRGRTMSEIDPQTDEVRPLAATAPDLGQFGTRAWWTSILTDFEQHFAPVACSGYDLEQSATDGMISWFRENQEVLRDEANKQDIAAMVEFLSAQGGRVGLQINQQLAARGQDLLSTGELTSGSITTCDSCHAQVGGQFAPDADNAGIPELNQYGSQAWLKAFISDPGHSQFYGDKNKMPAFAQRMSDSQRDMLVRFLTHDYAAAHVPDTGR